jgi:hypothetical protein
MLTLFSAQITAAAHESAERTVKAFEEYEVQMDNELVNNNHCSCAASSDALLDCIRSHYGR